MVAQATLGLHPDTIFAMMYNHWDNALGLFIPSVKKYTTPRGSGNYPPIIGSWPNEASEVDGPVLDAAGNLFVLDRGPTARGAILGSFAPPYTGPMKTVQLAALNLFSAHALAFNASGTLFVGDWQNNIVYAYAPPYTGNPIFRITQGISQPYWLGLDRAGNLFVANSGKLLTKFTPPYTGSPHTITQIPLHNTLAVDSDGELFVADQTGNVVREYTPPYTALPKNITTGIIDPIGLTIDKHHDLLVLTNPSTTGPTRSQKILEYAPPYTGSPRTLVDLVFAGTSCCDSGSWMQGSIAVRSRS